MALLLVKPINKLVKKIALMQCLTLFFVAFIFLITKGVYALVAALVGGLIYILPGYLYAKWLFLNISPRSIVRVVSVFYIGEILKLAISIILFILMLKFFVFPLVPYFVGYLVAALSFCVASMILMSKTVVSSL